MIDRRWVERNLGFDPISTPPPSSTFAFSAAARSPSIEDLQREIIDFDSEGAEGREFLAFQHCYRAIFDSPTYHGPADLSRKSDSTPRSGTGSKLPTADVLVVTWTVDEGHALSRVLTPGEDSRNDYHSYTNNFELISKKMRNGCPAMEAKRLGAYWTTKIGGKSVVVFKSDSHMSQDGPQLPNIDVWTQIISEVQPRLVITTGTAGGIGKDGQVGDVVVSPIVRFDCTSKFKSKPFGQDHYSSTASKTRYFTKAKTLFQSELRTVGSRRRKHQAAKNHSSCSQECSGSSVVTTDFFGFDTSDNHYHLQGLGAVSEMGRCRPWTRRRSNGREGTSLACGAQRLRSTDQGRGHS